MGLSRTSARRAASSAQTPAGSGTGFGVVPPTVGAGRPAPAQTDEIAAQVKPPVVEHDEPARWRIRRIDERETDTKCQCGMGPQACLVRSDDRCAEDRQIAFRSGFGVFERTGGPDPRRARRQSKRRRVGTRTGNRQGEAAMIVFRMTDPP